jgi:hypothetical protein
MALAVYASDNNSTHESSARGASTRVVNKFLASAQQGGIVQFTQSVNLIDEGSVGVTLTVTRTGDTSGVVSVDYATVDNLAAIRCDDTTTLPGVAFARCDYATWVDTLTFAVGETQKTFTIPIIDDAFVEPQESFQVQLSNLRGDAVLGTLNSTRVTITNNDRAGQPNPIDVSSFFVRQHYLDFLSREPETGEPWTRTLNNCPAGNTSCDRIQVSASFFNSPEFQLKGFFVFRFYKVAFGRLPDYTEIIPDMRRITGRTPTEVFQKRADYTNAFVRRQEFVSLYAGLSNQAYVAMLLGRYQLTQVTTPDPQQPDGTTKVVLTNAQLVSRLDAGTLTRAQVLRAVVQADEVGAAEFNKAFVAMQYYGYLRRNPDAAGYQGWLSFLEANPSDYRTMVRGFVDSVEYRLRFGNN